MSELTSAKTNRKALHAYLLSTACAFAVWSAGGSAMAEDGGHPSVWIDLGGQLERMASSQETFSPQFLGAFAGEGFDPIESIQRAPRYSYGGEGKIEFDPRGSGWSFFAAIRYGRSNGSKALYQRHPEVTATLKTLLGAGTHQTVLPPPPHLNASNKDQEAHAIIDFQVGRDIGIGLFSRNSKLEFGVRLAQFASHRQTNLNGVPSLFFTGTGPKYPGFFQSHYHFSGATDVRRSFRGIGPSISWNSSSPIVETGEKSSIELDWGINAAALFGRQKVSGQRNVTALHYKSFTEISFSGYTIYRGVASSYSHPHNLGRTHSVIVPNIGGFAGVSFRYAAAKMTFGYRGDFFFGAIDSGIAARKKADVGFYGPFASISIGF
jgi:hypothetical protein